MVMYGVNFEIKDLVLKLISLSILNPIFIKLLLYLHNFLLVVFLIHDVH